MSLQEKRLAGIIWVTINLNHLSDREALQKRLDFVMSDEVFVATSPDI